MPIKSVKMKVSKNKKMCFFGSFNPKIRFLCQKVCSVASVQTHRHESEYRGHPFRVSGIFPSTYQGSVQHLESEYSEWEHHFRNFSFNLSSRKDRSNTIFERYYSIPWYQYWLLHMLNVRFCLEITFFSNQAYIVAYIFKPWPLFNWYPTH